MKRILKFLSLAAALALSVSALAFTPGVVPGVVQEAPDIDLYDLPDDTPARGDYLPDASVYSPVYSFTYTPDPTPSPMLWPGTDWLTPQPTATPSPIATPVPALDWIDFWHLPTLSATEAARARQLISAYERGEVSGDGQSVIGVTENVVLGVYPLDPGQYDGERVYVLLPVTILSDEQLLSLIDAFDRLGLTFDPDALNYRNCMRGGYPESNRALAQEENARQQIIIDKIQRDAILPSDIAPDAGKHQYLLSLNRDAFSGLAFFRILPYRSLSDDELAALCFASGYTRIEDMGIYENMGFMLAYAVGAPLSVEHESTGIDLYLPVIADENGNLTAGEETSAVFFTGRYAAGQGRVLYYTSAFDRLTGEAIEFGWHLGRSAYRAFDEEPQAIFGADECLKTAIQECVSLLTTMQRIHHPATEGIRQFCVSHDEHDSHHDRARDGRAALTCVGISYGDEESLVCRAELNDGWWLDICVSTADGTVTSVSFTRCPFPYSIS